MAPPAKYCYQHTLYHRDLELTFDPTQSQNAYMCCKSGKIDLTLLRYRATEL